MRKKEEAEYDSPFAEETVSVPSAAAAPSRMETSSMDTEPKVFVPGDEANPSERQALHDFSSFWFANKNGV